MGQKVKNLNRIGGHKGFKNVNGNVPSRSVFKFMLSNPNLLDELGTQPYSEIDKKEIDAMNAQIKDDEIIKALLSERRISKNPTSAQKKFYLEY